MLNNLNLMISPLATNPWITVGSIFLAIIGIILSVIFYFKSKRTKKLKTKLRSINLLKDSIKKIDGLNIEFLGNPIPNLTITKLALWSNGNESIQKHDVPTSNPLSIIAINNATILEAKIIYEKNKHNLMKINASSDSKKVNIDFEFLDSEDGCVIQILHTGSSSSDIILDGTIIGTGKVYRPPSKKHSLLSIKVFKFIENKKYPHRIFGYICMFLGSVVTILPIFLILYFKKSLNSRIMYELFPLIFVGVSYFILGFFVTRRMTPKGFDIFEEGI